MTDITEKVFPGKVGSCVMEGTVEIKRATELYFTLVTKTEELTRILSKLQSSIPSEHIHDREAMEFLAFCNIEIQKLKMQSSKNPVINSIILCLYNRISIITKLVGEIQKHKEKAIKILNTIQSSRSNARGELPNSFRISEGFNEDYSEQNQKLLVELNKENELIENTRETAFQLSSILKFFHQKVAEQEYMSFTILKDAESSVNYMKTANYHLNSANERSKGMEKIWIAYFISLTLILVFYDWWTSRVVYYAD